MGAGFGVSGLVFRVQGFGCWGQGFGWSGSAAFMGTSECGVMGYSRTAHVRLEVLRRESVQGNYTWRFKVYGSG